MQSLDFLKLVLPDQGHYCWVTIRNKKVKQGFVPTIEQLEEKLLEEDAKGNDTYFACSSFSQPVNRQSSNVLATKAFWFDIDAGPGKPYKDADEAVEALDKFCSKTGLPFATIVCSGNGIHAWWPLDKSVTPKEWKEHAEKLKRLGEVNGLAVDPTRTADIASILRSPGTRNFKNPKLPREVSVWSFENEGGENSTYPLSTFNTARVDIVANWDKIKLQSEEKDFSLEKGYGDGERTQALTARAGYLLGIKQVSETECVELLLKWNTFNTPPLADEKIRSTVSSIFKSERVKRELLYGSMGELPKLPYGYKWDGRGRIITSVPIKDTDEWEEVAITEFPIYLEAVSRREREFRQAYVFRQWHPKEGWREFSILCMDFEGSSWKGHMADNGGNCILNDKLFKNYVHTADAELRRKQMDSVRYQQFGWKDDKSFLIGDTLIHDGGRIEKVYGSEGIDHRMKQMAPRKGGSLADWSADANLLFSDDFIHFGYVLVASFATTLLKFCMGQSDGGFVLSIMSSGSGKGKTRTIEAATSVWGELECLQVTPRDTVNAQFFITATACNLPIFMDEWNEKDPAILAKFLRQYTVGHDKNRSQKDGTVKSKPAEYKNMLITTSNHSIYDIMKMINDEGARARVLEVIAPDMAGDTFKRFDRITSRMLSNSGYAGREFIYQLMQPGQLEKVKADLEKATIFYREKLNTSGEHRFVAWLPAAITVASNILVRSGILEFDVKRLLSWSFDQAKQRVLDKGTAAASDMLSSFLTEYAGQCLMVSGPYLGKIPVMVLNNMGNIPNKITMRSERDSKILYISLPIIKAWAMKSGIAYENLAKDLEKEAILLNRKKYITLGAGTQAITGRTYCWEIDMSHPSMSGDIIEEAIAQLPEGENFDQ